MCISQYSPEKQNQTEERERHRDREREKDLKEVAHEVMEACKSKICRGRLAGLRPREELTM